MATLTSADFLGLIGAKTLLQITEEDSTKTVPNEQVIAAAGVNAENIMASTLGYDPNDATKLPVATFTEVRLYVARLVLYQDHMELLGEDPDKHPVVVFAKDALDRLGKYAFADEKSTGGIVLVSEEPVGLGRGF